MLRQFRQFRRLRTPGFPRTKHPPQTLNREVAVVMVVVLMAK
uniref:Uncharacterized protein n=1 Tax=Plectus sambesii TaxID=2011161 RepID=A0A914VHC3_9BILA